MTDQNEKTKDIYDATLYQILERRGQVWGKI